MRLSEFIQLLETMTVNDLLQLTVRIVADIALVIEHHQLTVFCRIGMPDRQFVNLRITRLGKLCPDVTHGVCQLQIFSGRLGQVVLRSVQGIETELQFVAVDRTVVQW